MKVRSITAFDSIGEDQSLTAMAREAGSLLRAARQIVQDAGIEVQTIRLALGPRVLAQARDPVAFARAMEEAVGETGIEYVSLGPVPLSRIDLVPEIVSATAIAFVSTAVAADRGIDERAVDGAARAMHAIARASDDGFGNLRFAATARCDPLIPFFPAAYHDGGAPAVAVALQAADVVGEALGGRPTLAEAPAAIARALEAAAAPVDGAIRRLARRRGRRYVGIDLSPAPFPDAQTSLAGAIESLAGARFGGRGTVAAAAAIVRGLRETRLQSCGFSGLMLPVLEDAVLARRTAEGSLGLTDLLLCSTVCGTGLDTVPLPGAATEEQLAAIIREMAALAVALDKPLTARLLPVPGKSAGEPTSYDFPYFANGRVLPI